MSGEKRSITLSVWPQWNKDLIRDEEITIAVQVNGRVRAEIVIDPLSSEEHIKEQALNCDYVKKHIAGSTVKRIIYVKGRLVNIVI